MNALCEGDEGVAGTAQFLSCLLKILTQCELSVKILSCGGDLQTALNAVDEVTILSFLRSVFFFVLKFKVDFFLCRVSDFWSVLTMSFYLWTR